MIILTGGAGFIGSALLKFLNEAGHKDIIVVDNLRSSDKWKNLNGKLFKDYWPRERLISEVRANRLPKGIKAVIHLGACSSTLEKDLDYLIENNYRYTLELADFCVNNNIRFIYASSGATYGDGKQGFSDQSDLSLLRPLNPYGFSKQLFDLKAQSSGILDEIVGIKFFNVFGPNEYHKGSMQSMILKGFEQVLATGKLQLYKSTTPDYRDGGQLRDFIYIKDCCQVILWFLENAAISGIYNLGSGGARSWNDVANSIFKAMKKDADIKYIDMPSELARQYQNFTEADMRKLRAAGYSREFTSLESAIEDYISAYLLKDRVRL